ASPRIASLRFSSSSRYESAKSSSMRSVPSSRRSSIPGSSQCHGSSTNNEPSLPIASSSSRSTSAVPQSNTAVTPPANASVPADTQSVPVEPSHDCIDTDSGSPPATKREPFTQ